MIRSHPFTRRLATIFIGFIAMVSPLLMMNTQPAEAAYTTSCRDSWGTCVYFSRADQQAIAVGATAALVVRLGPVGQVAVTVAGWFLSSNGICPSSRPTLMVRPMYLYPYMKCIWVGSDGYTPGPGGGGGGGGSWRTR